MSITLIPLDKIIVFFDALIDESETAMRGFYDRYCC